ncbi:hypothetical protein PG999_004136 [Apiospora kogelbergensis]|uniref:Uncharacterized protein n=1 Tax=Apiospora kogelbergensis TaxID=1337665 RepID=A0AAW0R5E4_9PEZI
MRGFAPFLALLLANASSLVNAVPVTAETAMTQVSGSSPSWTDSKTGVKLAHPNGLHVMANKYFNYVKKQAGAYTGGSSGKNSLLVAVVYNPKTDALVASTIPRGDLLKEMKTNDAKTKAPAWSHARETLQGKSFFSAHKDRLDAEDAAYYLLEKNGGFKATAGSMKYGDGTKENSVWISVWGTLHANVPEGSDQLQKLKALPGSRVDLCSDPTEKQPDCTALSKGLGTYFEPLSAPAPAPAKNNNNENRPKTPPPAGPKRPASQSPPKSPKEDKPKKNKNGKRNDRRAAIPVEVEA